MKKVWTASRHNYHSSGHRTLLSEQEGFKIVNSLDREDNRKIELRIRDPRTARGIAEALLRYADEHEN